MSGPMITLYVPSDSTAVSVGADEVAHAIHAAAQKAKTEIKLIRNGNVVAQVKSGAPAFLVSPGNYEADVPVRGKTVRVKGLVFFEGTEQVVPVRAQL